MQWTVREREAISESQIDDLGPACLEVYREAFGRTDWSVQGILRRIRQSDLIMLAHQSDGTLGGYALFACPQEPLDGRWLLWANNRAMRPPLQGGGLGRAASRVALEWAAGRGRPIGWVGSRTQNWRIVKGWADLARSMPGVTPPTPVVYPFTASYRSEEGARLRELLHRQVRQLDGGVVRPDGIYERPVMHSDSAAELGVSTGELSRLGTVFCLCVQQWLDLSGFRPDQGFAMVVVAPLDRARTA